MYKLKFVPSALDEWQQLDGSVKKILQKQLRSRLEHPHIASAALKGELAGCYKIKLLRLGYRLVYTVEDDVLVVLVLAVNKRDDMLAYKLASARRPA